MRRIKTLSKLTKVAIISLFGVLVVGGASASKLVCVASDTYQTQVASIPFSKSQFDDPNLDRLKTNVKTVGVNGEKKQVWKTTVYKPFNCKAPAKTLTKEEITKMPVAEVTAVGAKTPDALIAKPSTLGAQTTRPSSLPSPTTNTSPTYIAPTPTPIPNPTPGLEKAYLVKDIGFGKSEIVQRPNG